MGEHLTFKALVGTASLEADARAAGGSSTSSGDEQEDWFAASRRPAPTEATGALPATYCNTEGRRILVNLSEQQRVTCTCIVIAAAADVIRCGALLQSWSKEH